MGGLLLLQVGTAGREQVRLATMPPGDSAEKAKAAIVLSVRNSMLDNAGIPLTAIK
jgi:hypothetical protein